MNILLIRRKATKVRHTFLNGRSPKRIFPTDKFLNNKI